MSLIINVSVHGLFNRFILQQIDISISSNNMFLVNDIFSRISENYKPSSLKIFLVEVFHSVSCFNKVCLTSYFNLLCRLLSCVTIITSSHIFFAFAVNIFNRFRIFCVFRRVSDSVFHRLCRHIFAGLTGIRFLLVVYCYLVTFSRIFSLYVFSISCRLWFFNN